MYVYDYKIALVLQYRLLGITIDIREYIDWLLDGLPALFWSSSYVTSHCLSVASQSGAKQKFYFTVNYLTLNSNFEAQRTSKNLKNIVEDRVRGQK
jgi:hypothetical protein